MGFIQRIAKSLKRRLAGTGRRALSEANPEFDEHLSEDRQRIASCVEEMAGLTSLLMFNLTADSARRGAAGTKRKGDEEILATTVSLSEELEKLDSLVQVSVFEPQVAPVLRRVKHLSLIEGGRR